MSQAVSQLAVIRQEDQPLAPLVEPPHRKQPKLIARDQVDRTRPPGRIGVRAQIAARLVQQKISRRIPANELAVDSDLLPPRIDARPQIADDLAVNADPPGNDVLFAVAPGTQPGRSKEPLQPNTGCSGVVVIRFVSGCVRHERVSRGQ